MKKQRKKKSQHAKKPFSKNSKSMKIPHCFISSTAVTLNTVNPHDMGEMLPVSGLPCPSLRPPDG